jgi:MFS family permease
LVGSSESSSGDKPTAAENDLTWCVCFKLPADRKTALIIMAAVLYYFNIGLTSVSLSLLINQRIAGNAEEPNSMCVFVQTTVVLIHSTTSFFLGRYTSGLGDYIGRKPMLILSGILGIVTRYMYYSAHSPSMFYFSAILSGALDLYYFTSLAWICDMYKEGTRRSKRVGLFTGTVGGLTFTIAAPMGAVLATYVSPGFPFLIAPILSLGCIIMLFIMPVEDTIGVMLKNPSELRYVTSTRAVPADWRGYLKDQFPIGSGLVDLCKRAKHPLDWVTNYLMHISTAVLLMIFIQYALAVMKWSGPVASAAVLFVGFCLGLFAPSLLHRFNPVPLAFYAMFFFSLGMGLLSAAGTGMTLPAARLFGTLGVLSLGLGISWVPALQSNLTSQYPPDVQGAKIALSINILNCTNSDAGVVSGLLGQQNDFSMWPSYIMSLGFAFSLQHGGAVYWPGCTFGMVAAIGGVCLCLHYHIYGSEALVLTRRVSLGATSVPADAATTATAVASNPILKSPDDRNYLTVGTGGDDENGLSSGAVADEEEGDVDLEGGGIAMSAILPQDDIDECAEQEPVLMENFILAQP